MIPTEANDVDWASQDLPIELRRAWTVHRSEDVHHGPMLSGVVADKDEGGVVSPYLLRQQLILQAYPFRTSRISVAVC
ncbi:MAG TPA: hypothetical protein VEX16_09630 [Methyloceanibacter sp.]|nr:hypothetical protein [Methyloceanibacter sp.]